MNCFHCGSADLRTVDTRELDGENARRRRYLCNQCQRRFTTMEVCIGERLRYGELIRNARAFNNAGVIANFTVKQLCDEIVRRAQGGNDV